MRLVETESRGWIIRGFITRPRQNKRSCKNCFTWNLMIARPDLFHVEQSLAPKCIPGRFQYEYSNHHQKGFANEHTTLFERNARANHGATNITNGH